MFSWIGANWASIVTTAVLLGVLAAAIAVLHRDKKAGRGSCGGDCSRCAHCGGGCLPPKN